MLPGASRRLFGRWSEPIGGTPAPLAMVLRWLAILLRLYAGVIFVQYGYDKLLGGNVRYAMDAQFFQAVGVPFPELTQVLIGLLELVGGLALIAGLFTRVFGFLLACNMVVATLTVGNTSAELPLLICCALLVWTGGGMLSLDQLIDRRLGTSAARVDTADRPIRS